MTEKEAIKVIKKGERDFCEIYQSECLGKTCNKCEGSIAYNMAIKALEKQIPKKPIKHKYEIVCPSCKTLVGSSPYCRYCGQALDWSEKE